MMRCRGDGVKESKKECTGLETHLDTCVRRG